jgi:hypothetical protein
MVNGEELLALLQEAKQLAAIFTAAVKTANSRQPRKSAM